MRIYYIVNMVREHRFELEIDDTDTMDEVYRKVAMAKYDNVNVPIVIEHLKTHPNDAYDGKSNTHVDYILSRKSRDLIKTEIEPTMRAGRASDIFEENDVINVKERGLQYRHRPPYATTLSGGARNYRRKSRRKSSRRKSSRRKSKRKSSGRKSRKRR